MVAFCDQDSVWLPNKLEGVARSANEFTAGLLVHSGRVVDERLKDLGCCFPNIEETSLLTQILTPLHGILFSPGFALVVNHGLLRLMDVNTMVQN